MSNLVEEHIQEIEHKEIGVYLKAKREELGISKYRLAKDSQLSHTYISQLESGLKSNPSPEILDKLAQALGINNIDLLIKAGVISQDDLKRYTI